VAMIYDCFTFFNELELLELRLHELAGVVDKFVLVEATQTHTNQPKPLHYQENRARFSAFHDKIIHVIVSDLPQSSDPWIPENFQRNSIARGLTNCRPDDFVLVSDLDEIPRASTVEKMSREIPFQDDFFSNAVHAALNSRTVKSVFHRRGFRRRLRKNHPFVWRFEHTLYRYFMNCKSLQPPLSYGTVMLRHRDFSTAEELRHSGFKTVPDAGWNFTWMGGVDRILTKIRAFAHQEHNQPQFTDPPRILESIEQGHYLLDDSNRLQFVPLDGTFPRYVLEHPENFSGWIHAV
jgi:beta-1,4-mannosyl-glycoprotein beta-1,4-N-acetylglucosaminyltransferase